MQNEMLLIASAIMVFSMVKKSVKPLFGQLTLTGEMALDWIKKDKVNEITAAKIWFCNISALVNDWNTQPWMLEKGIVALIFPANEWGNPLFISQKSILRKTCIEFEENQPVFKIYREENARDFDPYVVEIE